MTFKEVPPKSKGSKSQGSMLKPLLKFSSARTTMDATYCHLTETSNVIMQQRLSLVYSTKW